MGDWMDNHDFCTYIANISIKSILYEVSATLKPGLVDRNNSGAHRDMNFFTFLNSTSVLYPYFHDCTNIGTNFREEDYTHLLKNIRPLGIKAEEDMFRATRGINTHKGLIFSLGIINAALGSLFKEHKKTSYYPEVLRRRIMDMTKGILGELDKNSKDDISDNNKYTYGEKLFKKYGIKGIRGEVEAGFPTVVEISLPVFQLLIDKETYAINDILVHTLLHLIKSTEDSNILGRHNMDILDYSQIQAEKALDMGGYLTPKGREFVRMMDYDFIEKNISPGGGADLLAITTMFFLIENGDIL